MVKKVIFCALILCLYGQQTAFAQAQPAVPQPPAAQQGGTGQQAVLNNSFDNCTASKTSTPANKTDDHIAPCFVLGVLTVPFKMELSRNRDVFGSATLNGMAGFTLGNNYPWLPPSLNFLGQLTVIGFLGYTQNLSGANSSSSGSSSLSGVSYGGGLAYPVGNLTSVGSPGSQVHVGLIVGFDHANNNAHFQYNDKPWISTLIGLSF